MISFILAILTGVLCGFGYSQISEHASFGIYITGFISTLIAFIFINKKMTKPLNVIFMKIQKVREEAQETIQKKAKHLQSRPGGNQAAFMKTAEKLQEKSNAESIELLKGVEQYYKWNFMIEKQVNTMRFQLYFQMKKYEEADKYLKDVMLVDPMSVGMKMARLYKKYPLDKDKLSDEATIKSTLKAWEVTKVFRKGAKRMKGSNSALLFSTYAWILVKSGLATEALVILQEGLKKSADEIIAQNIDRLRNNKPKSYSNAKYGDQWYALYLEEPPKQKPKMVRQKAGRQGRPF